MPCFECCPGSLESGLQVSEMDVKEVCDDQKGVTGEEGLWSHRKWLQEVGGFQMCLGGGMGSAPGQV